LILAISEGCSPFILGRNGVKPRAANLAAKAASCKANALSVVVVALEVDSDVLVNVSEVVLVEDVDLALHLVARLVVLVAVRWNFYSFL
jgi:hypothetical protein